MQTTARMLSFVRSLVKQPVISAKILFDIIDAFDSALVKFEV